MLLYTTSSPLEFRNLVFNKVNISRFVLFCSCIGFCFVFVFALIFLNCFSCFFSLILKFSNLFVCLQQ